MKIAETKKICIICEGYEEYDYMDTLNNKRVFSNKYDFKLINVKSINNILPRYQEKFQSDSYSLVLIFCDTDKEYKIITQQRNREKNCLTK